MTTVSGGNWVIYNASTYAVVQNVTTISGGPGGDAEPIWHPTDPTKFYYLENYGGLKIRSIDTDTWAVTVEVDFTGRLPWADVTRCWSRGGVWADKNLRYMGFIAQTAGFGIRGFFTYDFQTDTIIATKSLSEQPEGLMVSPLGNYVMINWWEWQLVDGVGGRVRAYTRDLTDWTYIHCSLDHDSWAIGTNGHEYYVSGDYTSGGGPAEHCPASGYVFMKDVQAAWVSEGYATPRTNLMSMYTANTARAFHVSGNAFNRPGVLFLETYECLEAGGTCPQSIDNRLYMIPMTASPQITTLAHHRSSAVDTYWPEPRVSANRAGTKVVFASNWDEDQVQDDNVDFYVLDLPSDAFTITTTTLPNGTNGQAYQADAETSGGTQPPTACVTSAGAVPTGASWSVSGNACRLSDASAETGTYNFTLQATDSNSNTDTQAFTLDVIATLQIDTASPMPDGTVSSGYSEQLVCSGGTPPRTFSCCQAGSLPTGVTLESNGTFSGSFQQAGVFNFTPRCTDNVAATADKALQVTVGSGVLLSMRSPVITVGDTYALFRLGADGLDSSATCQVIVRDGDGATVDTINSTSGPAVRNLLVTGLTAATTYSATFSCSGATPDVTPYPFVTAATPTGGARTVPLQFGAPAITLPSVARLTVEYDDNEALSTPATSQNTNCATGCTVNLSLTAGLYYYRWKWQTAADVVLATSAIQALPVP